MSDTPRTDAAPKRLFMLHMGLGAPSGTEMVKADFARELERELVQAQKDAARWRMLWEHGGRHYLSHDGMWAPEEPLDRLTLQYTVENVCRAPNDIDAEILAVIDAAIADSAERSS